MSSLAVQDTTTSTMCPVCWKSIHDDKPVGVTVGCGHVFHQDCYRTWQGTAGRVLPESSWQPFDSEPAPSPLKNCLVCQQMTQSFVDLFIRLPDASSVCRNKDLVTKLEHEFHSVSRRTQLSLEKEIARREFEQTWLQEERQISLAARQRVEQRHATAIQALEESLEELKINYQRKLKRMQTRNSCRYAGTSHLSNDYGNPMGRSLASLRVEQLENDSFNSVNSSQNELVTDPFGMESNSRIPNWFDTETQAMSTIESGQTVAWFSFVPRSTDSPYNQEHLSASPDTAEQTALAFNIDRGNDANYVSSTTSPTTSRANIPIQNDTVALPIEPNLTNTPEHGQVQENEILVPTVAAAAADSSPSTDDEKKLPAEDVKLQPSSSDDMSDKTTKSSLRSPAGSRKRKGGDYCKKTASSEEDDTLHAVRSVVEYERQRLQAETAYFQHQAELVEWERHQAEIELEQDELALQQRVQRIRLERSRLEESFTSIQRRVEESKQEARDRQKLTAMEQKFLKYKVARAKEETRFQQELEHLKQDDIQIVERETSEKKRQETEKVRLKKELNELVKVMSSLERAKDLMKLGEEQSSSSQTQETCVVCFEPLVNEESELGVAVPCGHTFHSHCFAGWEKSKRRRGSSSVPCPLCNVATNLCVTIRLNRPESSSLCCAASSSSSLARHFQKEEGRWQRRRITGTGEAL
jgi:Ring finger domain